MNIFSNKETKRLKIWPSEINAFDILHSLPDGVFFTDPQMRIIYFNPTAEKITGFRSFEAHGMYCKDVLKSGLCETECVVKKALDVNENIFNVETTIITATGETIPVLSSASIIKDSSGNIVGYLYSFRDISLLKKVMSDLENSKAKLAERNVELDHALEELKSAQEQLIQSQKMEALGTLAGGIAHDFNNILTGILGFASLIKTEISPDHVIYRYVEQIERSAARAAQLTGNILTFARRSQFELKTVNINKSITNVLQILERAIYKNIKIKLDIGQSPCYVEVDESKMEQALMNICVNAVEAMIEGGCLTIKTEVFFDCSRDKEFLKISIIDTGIGMDEETSKRIFEPFFTTKKNTGGTGLGLSIVYGIIKDFGGYIEVETVKGYGTAFHVNLPLSEQAVNYISTDETVDISTMPRGNGETILLVDDEMVIRKVGKSMLEHLGYNVIVAENGFIAIELYEKYQKDIKLVILDLIMPELGGKEVFERLKEINPEVKIIVSTGYANEEIIRPLLDENKNMYSFLEKPYKIQEMAEGIKNALKA